MLDLDLALRTAGAIVLVALGALVAWRQRGAVGWLGGVLAVTVAAHLVCPFVVHAWGLRWQTLPMLAGCIAVPAVFWLFSGALFDDRFRLRRWHAVPVLLLVGLGLAHIAFRDDPHLAPALSATVSILSRLAALAFVIAALMRVVGGLASDLVDARRRLRAWVAGLAAAYMVVVVAVELHLRGGPAPPALSALSAALIVTIAVAVSGILLLTPSAERDAAAPPDEADRLVADRVRAAMDEERVHRREGLTIARLAAHLHVPEYRLRRVINRSLGFRNFNDFVNHHRVRDACAALEDPRRAGAPIVEIALEVGYQSLSPFNRAFKAHTGLTPSRYRRDKLAHTA